MQAQRQHSESSDKDHLKSPSCNKLAEPSILSLNCQNPPSVLSPSHPFCCECFISSSALSSSSSFCLLLLLFSSILCPPSLLSPLFSILYPLSQSFGLYFLSARCPLPSVLCSLSLFSILYPVLSLLSPSPSLFTILSPWLFCHVVVQMPKFRQVRRRILTQMHIETLCQQQSFHGGLCLCPPCPPHGSVPLPVLFGHPVPFAVLSPVSSVLILPLSIPSPPVLSCPLLSYLLSCRACRVRMSCL